MSAFSLSFKNTDIDECDSRHNCGNGMICENTHGGYNCVCPPGFKQSETDNTCAGELFL